MTIASGPSPCRRVGAERGLHRPARDPQHLMQAAMQMRADAPVVAARCAPRWSRCASRATARRGPRHRARMREFRRPPWPSPLRDAALADWREKCKSDACRRPGRALPAWLSCAAKSQGGAHVQIRPLFLRSSTPTRSRSTRRCATSIPASGARRPACGCCRATTTSCAPARNGRPIRRPRAT